ncbi:MAG: cheB 2 [Armatimonadetes bacterium]|nr:cheB 2 [Armatimonadota bacterium]
MSGTGAPPPAPGDPAAIEVIVIGASAGAVEALSLLLPPLPADFPVALLIVVHLPRDRDSLLAELLGARCRVKVKEAEDKERIEGGTVYFAPPDYHLLVEPDRSLSLSVDEPVRYSRPSIDVLFESAADVYGERLLGIVLTGANSDGAQGLRTVCEAGGKAIVQAPETASAPFMPQAALGAWFLGTGTRSR